MGWFVDGVVCCGYGYYDCVGFCVDLVLVFDFGFCLCCLFVVVGVGWVDGLCWYGCVVLVGVGVDLYLVIGVDENCFCDDVGGLLWLVVGGKGFVFVLGVDFGVVDFDVDGVGVDVVWFWYFGYVDCWGWYCYVCGGG